MRPRLAIFGASGFIGNGLCHYMSPHYDTIAITRSPHRAALGSPGLDVVWRVSDFFRRPDLEKVLNGVDYAIYLAHTRVPTARLDQARCEDMDLLQAANFARAAAVNKVRHIVYLGGMIPQGNVSRTLLQSRNEVTEELAGSGIAVTTIRCSLIVGPGSSAITLLEQVVRRAPLLLVPMWALGKKQPITLTDVMRAFHHCLGSEEMFGKSYDIGGPDIITLADILEHGAHNHGRTSRVHVVKRFPKPLFKAFVRLLSPRTHPSLISIFTEAVKYDTLVSDNPLQRYLAEGAGTCFGYLANYLDADTGALPHSPRERSVISDKRDFERSSSVRSIQRVRLPAGTDPGWLAHHYFTWLGRAIRPLIRCRQESTGQWLITLRLFGITLLQLQHDEPVSTPDKQVYAIIGGLLSGTKAKTAARMEFQAVSRGRFAIIAIHDFRPFLLWRLYRFTQATIHGWVMAAFQRHLQNGMVDER
jgi:uncharacterized protein YbjT (DUF2867 family)